MFTCFEYRYRDASNFKAYGSVALLGELSPSEVSAIRRRFGDDGFFVAEQLDLPPLYEHLYQWSNGPTDADHCWHEFVGITFSEELPPNVSLWGEAKAFASRVLSVSEWKGQLSPHFWLDA